ncbi:DUF5357 family protein [Trichocoleus sp. FACHB-90]|uniref:DUF5357 family protein n=1 Tax=Cyanophyceae TaxID=3028117 RepID=UPI001689652C|nr:DUF5357 family protein [Trichocoleus sp. FACHB-90]MBD1924998.1 DUF5357 family protein [Trichocoleus sp. FACHB-90]
MFWIVVDIKDFFKFLQSLIEPFIPSRAYSWKTLIYLSTFSWVMSLLTTDEARDFISFWGWIFLIAGTSWASTENKIKIGNLYLSPWITGALICTFVFGNRTPEEQEAGLIIWPTLSALIAIGPDFLDQGMKLTLPKPAIRKRDLILLTSNILISCWIQFYFVAQNWLSEYPTLMSDDFSQSAFMFRMESTEPIAPRGAIVLDFMEPLLEQELDNKPWSEVERWLLQPQPRIDALKQEAIKGLPSVEEDLWWQYTSKISSINSGYNLQLLAIWQGPRSQPEVYYINKPCQITQTYEQADTNSEATSNETRGQATAIAEVSCQPASTLKENQATRSQG